MRCAILLRVKLTASKHIDQVKSELEDSNAKLTGLQTKLDELDKSKKICEGRISAAKSMCDQYTRSDILRFKGKRKLLSIFLTMQRSTSRFKRYTPGESSP